jgi:hypothetical protein
MVRVGKLSRYIASAGPLRFAVPLGSLARRALRQSGRLSVAVKTVVTPPSGSAAIMSRRVQLHD